jgi:alkanesulfonate monooxygenase SsuD/methylene tetrahydromethanopterin reductase-like flavin-dependent oxidoreductase (luciferase family)
MTVHVGLGLVTAQVPPGAAHSQADEYDDALRLVQLAEDLGFDSVWFSEHHLAEDGYLPSPVVLMSAAAALTRRITLGTAVLLAPLQDPLRFAEDWAVLDQLSHGRIIVGLGAGWRRVEFEHFGVSLRERGRRTAALVAACREAWSESSPVTPKPHGDLPIFMGGSALKAIERSAEMGDGFLATPNNDLAKFVVQVAQFDEAASRMGRGGTCLPIGFHVNGWVSDDGEIPDAVLEAMWQQVGRYQLWHAIEDGATTDANMPPVDEQRLRARTVYGTPADVVGHLAPWIEPFGARDVHVIVRLHYPGQRLADVSSAIKQFSVEVLPRLKGLHGK